MPRVNFSGERPEPFDGMMMSFDASKDRAEKEKKKAEFFKSKSAEQAKIDEEFNKDEDAWKMHDKLTEEHVVKSVGHKSKFLPVMDRKIDNTRNRIPAKKGEETLRKVSSPDFEVPEDGEGEYEILKQALGTPEAEEPNPIDLHDEE